MNSFIQRLALPENSVRARVSLLAVACIIPSTYIIVRNCAFKLTESALMILSFNSLHIQTNTPIHVDFASKKDEKELYFRQLEEEMSVRRRSDRIPKYPSLALNR